MQPVHTTAVPPPPSPLSGRRIVRPRHLQWAGFIAGIAWYFCARALAASAANGISYRLGLDMAEPLLEAAFQVFLVVVGIGLLSGIERRRAPLQLTLGLPPRRTARTEWGQGAALGWALAIACVLPILLFGTLDVRPWMAPRAWVLALLNLATLGLLSLGIALGVFGYAFQRLIDASGPVRATTMLAILASLYAAFSPDLGGPPGLRIVVTLLATILLCLCWVRTHGLWLLWGLSFAWMAAIGVLFGLPLAGSGSFASLVETRAFGPPWLTGGDFGPGAALLSAVFLLTVIAALVPLTSDYAWQYTHAPIIPAGYAVDVPPPAEHVAMEAAPPPAPRLIQILPATPPPEPAELHRTDLD